MINKTFHWLDNNLLKLLIGFLIAFIPLWPKLPLVGIPHTWVYIRLEDIFVALVFFLWFIYFLRRKVSLSTPLTLPMALYWSAGLISLVYTLIFTAPHLANFFPNVAVLHFLRRIEYLGMFLIAFSTVKSKKDLVPYLWVIILTVLGVVFYGFGQKFLGFPAYLTMNEEFAKGVPLKLASTSRLSSTFAGHYDLAAYLVMMIAFLTGLIFGVKNLAARVMIFFTAFLSLVLLLFTASRVSFLVYLLAVSFSLWLSKKKILIIPVIVLSILLLSFVGVASDRFSKTFRVRSVVYNIDTGKPVGTLEDAPSGSVKQGSQVLVPITTETKESLPVGSGFIGLGQSGSSEATSVATIKKPVPMSLKYSSYSAEIATISGSFLIQKALVYDISFTTRFQGEWPRALNAFKTNPLVGTGYSSIGLSTDGDYLRMLGEVGIVGSVTFLLIFAFGGIFLKRVAAVEKDNLVRSAGIGLAAGVLGLMVNAVLIDVYEASKVAFSLWILAGLVTGSLAVTYKDAIPYLSSLKKMLTGNIFIFLYLIIGSILCLFGGLNIYFAGDDFTWLRWAADSTFKDIPRFFLAANGFFYRPLAKTIYLLLYNIFWLQPQGYHLVALVIHVVNVFLIYLIAKKLWGNKIWSFVSALFFLVLSIHGENLFWMPASLEMLAPLFALLSFYLYLNDRQYLAALFFFPALLGHEGIITYPLIIVGYDLIFNRKRNYRVYATFLSVAVLYLLIRFSARSHWFNGDYSYNLANLPFNFFGNFAAYFSGVIGTSRGLEIINGLRGLLRVQKLLSGFIGIGLFIFAGLAVIKNKNKLASSWVLFFLIAFFLALLPYLGLGNASDRYAYFASAWLVLLVIYLLKSYVSAAVDKTLPVGIVVLILISALYFNLSDLSKTQKDWAKAGDVTYTTYLLLRQNFLLVPKNSTFYISNLPIRLGRAWIFPVGFDDGVWQLFRDKNLKVVKVKGIEEGLEAQKTTKNSYVFTFDNLEIKEVR